MWTSVLTTVLNISLLNPVIGLLKGRNVQEWKFKSNDKLSYLAVTALTQQSVISLLRCDVACSQHPGCVITVYNRSISQCAQYRLFREQDITATILTGNFDVRHFLVNAKTSIVPSCLKHPPSLNNALINPGSKVVGCVRWYTCFRGYRDTSTNTMTANTTCLENLTWSVVSLNCSIPSCLNQPPPLKNAIVSDGSQLVGSVRTYTCQHGYRDASSNQTTSNTTCLRNLTWSRPSLKCIVPSCLSQPPPLKNAIVSDGSQLVNSIRTYMCHHGYRDTSSNETTANTTCLGNLTWSRVALKCLVPSCLSQPPPLKNAIISDGSQLVGSVRTYTCHHGYRDTSRNQTTSNTTCLGNLTWSRVILKCLAKRCPSKLPSVPNAEVSSGSRTVGSSRRYTCHHGYRDKSTGLNIAQIRCLHSLRWSRPNLSCSAERCPSKLPSVPNADVTTGSRTVGSSRRYTCHRGYRDKSTGLNIAQTRCLHSLRWSRPDLSCSAQGCPSKPPHIENAHVSGRGSSVGSVRKYTCREGYMDTSDPKGTNEARCRENFRWSQPGLHCSGPWLRKETEATKKGRKYVELTEEELKHVFADTTLIFQVKTCHDANINYGKYETNQRFRDKISIGGGKNTFWKIFPCSQIKENNIVSCEEFRSFWIKFHGNVVRVGKGETVGEKQVIRCEHPYKVIHLRISTYVRNAGAWLFKIHGG